MSSVVTPRREGLTDSGHTSVRAVTSDSIRPLTEAITVVPAYRKRGYTIPYIVVHVHTSAWWTNKRSALIDSATRDDVKGSQSGLALILHFPCRQGGTHTAGSRVIRRRSSRWCVALSRVTQGCTWYVGSRVPCK